jgi:hypothetical protein
MVETITPVVHGGRRDRWAQALAMHVAGATAAAAAFGALLGGTGALLGAPWGSAGIVVVIAVAVLYLTRDVLGLPVPVPQLRRQVPDWWRTFFPFGPASFLYGLGLGVGFFTYLAHGTLVVVSATAVVGGRPLVGAVVLAPFGLARGLSAAVAGRARTAEEGSALVATLGRASSWPGWRVAHVAALAGVIAAAVANLGGGALEPRDAGAIAAATLAVAFGAAALAKVLRRRAWIRSLETYGLPPAIRHVAALGVPVAEGGLALLPFLGLPSIAGLASLVALAGFSVAIVVGRLRAGRLLDCGCFGGPARDYRVLLARNCGLGVLAVVAWRYGVNAPVGGSLGPPGEGELVPLVLVLGGLALATALVVQAFATIRRRTAR